MLKEKLRLNIILFTLISLFCFSSAFCLNKDIIFGKTTSFSPAMNKVVSVTFDQNLPFFDPVVFASVESAPEALDGGDQVPIRVEVQSVTLTGATFQIKSNLTINSASDVKIHYFVVNRNGGQRTDIVDDNGSVLSYQVQGSPATISFYNTGNFTLDGLAFKVDTINPLSVILQEGSGANISGKKTLKDDVPPNCQDGTFSYTKSALNSANPVDRSDYSSTCNGIAKPDMAKVGQSKIPGDQCNDEYEHDDSRGHETKSYTSIHNITPGKYSSNSQCLQKTECSNGCQSKYYRYNGSVCGYYTWSYWYPAFVWRRRCIRVGWWRWCFWYPAIEWRRRVIRSPHSCTRYEPRACNHDATCKSFYYKPCEFDYTCKAKSSMIGVSPTVPMGSISIGTSVPAGRLYQVVKSGPLVNGSNIGHVLLDPDDKLARPSGPVTYISAQTNLARDFTLRLKAPQSNYVADRHGRGYKGLFDSQIEVKNQSDKWEKFEDGLPAATQWNLNIYDCKNIMTGESVSSPERSHTVNVTGSKVTADIRTDSLEKQTDPVACSWDLDAVLDINGESFDVFETAITGNKIYFGIENQSGDILFDTSS